MHAPQRLSALVTTKALSAMLSSTTRRNTALCCRRRASSRTRWGSGESRGDEVETEGPGMFPDCDVQALADERAQPVARIPSRSADNRSEALVDSWPSHSIAAVTSSSLLTKEK